MNMKPSTASIRRVVLNSLASPGVRRCSVTECLTSQTGSNDCRERRGGVCGPGIETLLKKPRTSCGATIRQRIWRDAPCLQITDLRAGSLTQKAMCS